MRSWTVERRVLSRVQCDLELSRNNVTRELYSRDDARRFMGKNYSNRCVARSSSTLRPVQTLLCTHVYVDSRPVYAYTLVFAVTRRTEVDTPSSRLDASRFEYLVPFDEKLVEALNYYFQEDLENLDTW